MMFFDEYKYMIENHGFHERLLVDYIEGQAKEKGFKKLQLEDSEIKQGDRLIFKFRDKFIALVKVGKNLVEGANVIVSHLDSPRLDVITGDPFIEEDDGVFLKTIPYGGIIAQSWLDRPLILVGRVTTEKGVIDINTKGEFEFVVTSLLPHLNGRDEMQDLKCKDLIVRIGNNKKENV